MPLEANRRRRSYAVSDSRSSDECSKMSNEQISPCKFKTAELSGLEAPAQISKFFCLFWFFLTLRLHVRRQPPLGRRQCETNKISACSKTLQNHHSTASTTADPVRAFANHPIVEISCMLVQILKKTIANQMNILLSQNCFWGKRYTLVKQP